MADTAEMAYEEFLALLLEARAEGRLGDELVREIAIVLKEGMPSYPPPGDGVTDPARIQLVILVSRADARGCLTAEVTRDILDRIQRRSQRPPSIPPVLRPSYASTEPERRDSMGPELIVGEASPEEIAGDTDPPPDEDG